MTEDLSFDKEFVIIKELQKKWYVTGSYSNRKEDRVEKRGRSRRVYKSCWMKYRLYPENYGKSPKG